MGGVVKGAGPRERSGKAPLTRGLGERMAAVFKYIHSRRGAEANDGLQNGDVDYSGSGV